MVAILQGTLESMVGILQPAELLLDHQLDVSSHIPIVWRDKDLI